MAEGLVFLLDVDNTLFDNDAFKEAITVEALLVLGQEGSALFWQLYEEVRRETQTVDFPRTLERLAGSGHKQESEHLRDFLQDYDFGGGLYPQTLETLGYLGTLGTCVILSDGDCVFQLYKIQRAGLAAALDGRVLIYVHKEQHLDEIAAFYPASHYVMVDDKPRILEAIKGLWADHVTTLFVRQGHYAAEALAQGTPRVDLQVATIGAARDLSPRDFGGS